MSDPKFNEKNVAPSDIPVNVFQLGNSLPGSIHLFPQKIEE
jgi:hypothetical protein